jgi:hypothetical protein
VDRFNIALIALTALVVVGILGAIVFGAREQPKPERDYSGYGQLQLSDTVCYAVLPGQKPHWDESIPVKRPAFDEPTPLRPRPPVDPRNAPAAAGDRDAPVNLVADPSQLPASSFVTGDRQSLIAAGQTSGRATTLEIQRELNEARYGRSPLADKLNSAENSIFDDLKIVKSVFERYRTEFGENPVGLNEDMVRRLTGHNPKQIAFLPSDHSAINSEGQWIDRWGTPFHFHQISGTHLEIISGGPDQQVWTSDDVVHNPAELQQLLESQTSIEQTVSAAP